MQKEKHIFFYNKKYLHKFIYLLKKKYKNKCLHKKFINKILFENNLIKCAV